jgi:hypothetical protein
LCVRERGSREKKMCAHTHTHTHTHTLRERRERERNREYVDIESVNMYIHKERKETENSVAMPDRSS